MAWTLFAVPSAKRTELDQVLHDDQLSRQSQKVREAPSLGGPANTLFVLLEGSPEAVKRGEELLGAVGTRLPAPEAEKLHHQLKDEEEAASAGMGLFFTEG
jgi:hypothetical protein